MRWVVGVALAGWVAGCAKKTAVSEQPAVPTPAAAELAAAEPVVRVPPSRVDAILNESQHHYDRGMRAYQAGRPQEANRAFNDAIDVILRSGYPLDSHIELVEQIERILTGIVDFELNRTSEELVSELSEPAAEPGPPARAVRAAAGAPPAPPTAAFPLVRNPQVDQFIKLFQSRRDRRSQIEGGLSRAGRYLDGIRATLREEGLPEELAYVPVVESAYKVYAYSRARAKGLWQFIASTGSKYGLTINWWIDERSDPEKATRAAQRYLRFLYDNFGDWYLALAAYNCGEERVERAIARVGKRDFWELSRRRALPRETRDFVPQILAAMWIARDPAGFGFAIEPEPPLRYDTVLIDGSIDLQLVARCVGASLDEIRELNPELRRGITPRDARGYRLKLPADSRDRFLAQLASVPQQDRASYQRYIVQRGDTLGRIADRYGVALSELVQANRLHNIHSLGIGETLIVPFPAASGEFEIASASAAPPARGAATSSSVPRIHQVRRGDTLYALAQRYGTSIERLLALNHLRRNHTLHPGMELVVWRDGEDGAAQEPAAADEKVVYRVRRGDTLSKIARNFGASIGDLARWNQLEDVSYLLPGMLLTIYR
ncbi:MAG TPA: LysM peptidoglycan-binding domain-containing protein [Acidobacteriota bacterium]